MPYGGQRVSLELAKALASDHAVTIAMLSRPTGMHELPQGVELVCMGRRFRGPFGFLDLAWRMARFFDDRRFDGVIAFMTFANLVTLVGRLLSRTRPQVVVSEHTLTSEALPIGERHALHMSRLAQRLYPQARAVVAVSDAVARDLTANLGIPAALVRRIYNPVDAARLVVLSEASSADSWLEESSINLVCVAMLKEVKDHPTLLHAVALLPANYKLLLIGDGPLHQSLIATTEKLGLVERVKFGGWQRNPLPNVRAADLLVLSSKLEGFGLVVVEAAAVGTPAVVTSAGGLPEVAEMVGATVCQPGDPWALAQAIERAIQSGVKPRDDWRAATAPPLIAAEYMRLLE